MSSKDVRNSIIADLIPRMIAAVSGLSSTDERFVRFLNNAQSKIQSYQHYLSVNSHEIQRRLDCVGVRFVVSNFSSYAERLVELCDVLKEDPLCQEHYESDIQWSILSFLLEVARKPTAGFGANKQNIGLGSPLVGANENMETIEASNGIVVPKRPIFDSTDNLSEWSDSDVEDEPVAASSAVQSPSQSVVKPPVLPGIKPPSKTQYFQLYDEQNPTSWLHQNIQYAWWLDKDYVHPTDSSHSEAKFCNFWQIHLERIHKSIVPIMSTISENYVVKEILWMFIAPTTCKTFVVDTASLIVTVAKGVSINTLSQFGFQTFLEQFARQITIVLRLNTFCSSVNNDRGAPHSYESYAQSLQECMRPFIDWVLATEFKLAQAEAESDDGSYSLVRLQREMEPFSRFLDNLYDIYTKCTLDYTKYPGHICSSFLIAALLRSYTTSSSNCHSNLVAVLFMSAIKVYLQIIDAWWKEGRLEDWRNEFIIKNVDQANPLTGFASAERSDNFEMRLLAANKDCAFFISNHVSSTIESCKLTKMLCQHAIEAGYTLNILHSLDRIGEIKSQGGYQDNLYETFWEMTVDKMFAFCNEGDRYSPAPCCPTETPCSDRKVNELRSSLTTHSVLLAPVVLSSLRKCEIGEKPKTSSARNMDAYSLFERWNEYSSALLHFEEIVFQNIRSLLESRIASANRCVINMYLDEYQVLGHLKNLQKVYFMEAGDLMCLFYSNLFNQMETTEHWNNSYLLTDQLNGIICTKFPEMSSLFSVQVPARKLNHIKVTEAIDRISITYAVPPCLRDVISDSCLTKYNKVFRNLLKIKWGLWRLENMRFPVEQKNRAPYLPMNYFDMAFKRLAMVRIWVIHTLQCVHSHLITQVVQSMSDRLNTRIAECTTLTRIIAVHNSFINTIYDHCFLTGGDSVMVGVEQLLSLVSVVRNEWTNLSVDEVDSAVHQQIDGIEKAFIDCHRYISGELDKQLYSKNRNYLSGLCAAFSSSSPY